MDTITIFGDIHANLHALEAVFADMEARALPNLYCLGDLVGYGAFPNEVVAAMRSRDIPTLMGNYDQGVGNDSDDCGCAYKTDVEKARGERSIAWTNAQTDADHKAWLRARPLTIPVTLGDLKVLLVHGSPRRVNEYLYVDRPEASIERLFDQAGVDVLVCGHTHLPYHRVLPSGRHLINAGSVGKPKDGDPRAGYVMLSATGRELSVGFIRVAYDHEAAARAVEAAALPHEFAQMLREGVG
ncbi:MAG: metallophosphoesterase family protein [Anaerolineae bacterium]|nr:metallophosphoesterase family protein [Anaerolineae bacterium]